MSHKHNHTIHQCHFGWSNANQPVVKIAPGESIEFDPLDSSGGQITPQSTLAHLSQLDFGKVNPVAAEALNQVCFYVYGLDTTIGMAAEAGQLQLNAMEPVIVYSLHQAMSLLGSGVQSFIRTCVNDISPDPARCQSNLEGSSAFATELVTSIGYEAAAKLVVERRQSVS